MTDAASLARVWSGEPRAVARALSIVEDGTAEAADLLTHVYLRTGRAFLVGVTGPPGAGKSTLVSQLVRLLRAGGRRVGVLAIDPSSPYTGGALLGDRVRLQSHAGDAGVFIRSMATRGHAGGLARATTDAAAVLDAAGFDVVVIETVGVGQGEVEVVRAADVVVVTLVPGTGDDVQALKAGVMEIGDIFVVNKGDLAGVEHAIASVEGLLALDDRPAGTWRPPVLRAVATTGEGVPELIAALDRFRDESRLAIEARRLARATRRGPATAQPAVLDHVAIAVADPAASVEFFASRLGLTVGPAEDVPDQHVRVRFIETGTSRLELVDASEADSPVSKFLAQRGPGLHHIALRVPDLAGTLARLEAGGVQLVDRTPRRGAHGRWVAFVHPASTHGVLLELVQEEGRADAPR